MIDCTRRAALSLVLLIGSAAASGWAADGSQRSRAAAVDPGGANLPIQTIGPNDLLAVSVYDAPELTRSVRVGADGKIQLPMVKGRIEVDGLLPSEVEAAIAKALTAGGIMVDPVVTVTVSEYHSRPISVAGAVNNPTTFQASTQVTLLEAITRAGGLSPEAGSDILVTTREAGNGKVSNLTRRIPVKQLIDDADAEVNLLLTGGEEVRVPAAAKIFVVGNVKRPGAFPMRNGDEVTVLKMLALAEGLAPFASKQAFVIRRDDRTGGKHELPVPLAQIMQRKAPDMRLLPEDVLYIPDNTGRRTAVGVLERIAGFGASTATGVIIYRH